MDITRDMLKFDHYSWRAVSGDNPEITGKPDSSRFNRHEGYEVLPMIQAVINVLIVRGKPIIKTNAIHVLERMIRDNLPGEIQSRDKVLNWLVNNFQSS